MFVMENSEKKKEEKKFKIKKPYKIHYLGNINSNFEGEYLRINPYAEETIVLLRKITK